MATASRFEETDRAADQAFKVILRIIFNIIY